MRKRRRPVISRDIFVVILSLVIFAVVFLITGLVALLLSASFEPAGLDRGRLRFRGGVADQRRVYRGAALSGGGAQGGCW